MSLVSTTVSAILDTLRDYPAHTFSANEAMMTQDETSGLLFILIDGTAEVVKDEVSVAIVSGFSILARRNPAMAELRRVVDELRPSESPRRTPTPARTNHIRGFARKRSGR